jgi:hypothetical protein
MSYGYSPDYPPTRYDYGSGYAQPAPTRRSAPASVHVVALIQYLSGLVLVGVGVLAGMFTFGAGPSIDQSRFSQFVDVRGLGLAVGAIFVFVGLVVIVIGRKLQRGRQWVRLLVLALSAVSVGATLYNGLVGQGGTNVLFGLVIPVLYLVLLNLPAARSWFRSHTY